MWAYHTKSFESGSHGTMCFPPWSTHILQLYNSSAVCRILSIVHVSEHSTVSFMKAETTPFPPAHHWSQYLGHLATASVDCSSGWMPVPPLPRHCLPGSFSHCAWTQGSQTALAAIQTCRCQGFPGLQTTLHCLPLKIKFTPGYQVPHAHSVHSKKTCQW